MKTFYCLLSLMLFSNIIYSQNFKIKLLDSVNGEVIPFAVVKFSNTKGAYSDANGECVIVRDSNFIEIIHLAYDSKILPTPLCDTTVKLNPKTYTLNEIVVSDKLEKFNCGFHNYKSEITTTKHSGNEMAVYIANDMHYPIKINKVILKCDKRRIVRKDIGINFTSVFKINFYSCQKSKIKPDTSLISKDIIFNTKNIKKTTILDVSKYDLALPENGVFLSIEWVGIISKTGELNTDYKGGIEPFIQTTYKPKNTKIYIRDKFKHLNWQVFDKNMPQFRYFNKDNHYTPCIGLSN